MGRRKDENSDAKRLGEEIRYFHAVYLEVFSLQLKNKWELEQEESAFICCFSCAFFFFNWVFPLEGT